MTLFYLVIFAASVVIVVRSYPVCPECRHGARMGCAPLPQSDICTARPCLDLGGVAMFLAFALRSTVAAAGQLALSESEDRLSPQPTDHLASRHADISARRLRRHSSVGPYVKFAVQAVAATMLYAGGLRILDLPVLFGNHHFPWFVGLPLNDSVGGRDHERVQPDRWADGLAAGSALFSTLVVFVVAWSGQSPIVSLMSLALAGAAGIPAVQFQSGDDFLGDCGSHFIGFMLAALASAARRKRRPSSRSQYRWFRSVCHSGNHAFRRAALDQRTSHIHRRPRTHPSHKLLQRGLSHRQVVIVLYAVSAFRLLSLFLLWPTAEGRWDWCWPSWERESGWVFSISAIWNSANSARRPTYH